MDRVVTITTFVTMTGGGGGGVIVASGTDVIVIAVCRFGGHQIRLDWQLTSV